jgi:LmbE family N-acetylglucosaminyl deacetylase
MNIVAHQDDDLLFMNPDVLHAIKSGHCVRTVYVTAGDAGRGKYYWVGREQGSEAAYSTMLGLSNPVWVERTIEINNHEYATYAKPQGNPSVSLMFLHLPDGNLNGQGFLDTHYQSLRKLYDARISYVNTVDSQSYYSSGDLTEALRSLIETFKPSVINTQANYISNNLQDHSDHKTVGLYAKRANIGSDGQDSLQLKEYLGYSVHWLPPNINDGDLAQKEAAWFSYAGLDNAVCHSMSECNNASVYGVYLQRQYTTDGL